MIGFPLTLPLDANTARKISVMRQHDGKCLVQIELTSQAEYIAMAAHADLRAAAAPVQTRIPIPFTPRNPVGGAA